MFPRAADQGLHTSQFRLGLAYLNGWGIARDPQQALFWCQVSSRTTAVRIADVIKVTDDCLAGAGKQVDAATRSATVQRANSGSPRKMN